MDIDVVDIPNDLDHCKKLIHQLLEEIRKLQFINGKQESRIEQLLRHRYGQKADRFNPHQLMLDMFEIMDLVRREDEGEPEEIEQVRKKKKRNVKGHGRTPLPEH